MASNAKFHKRSPNGYSVKLWNDGFWHAYHGGTCLDELLTKQGALQEVWAHYEAQRQIRLTINAHAELNGIGAADAAR